MCILKNTTVKIYAKTCLDGKNFRAFTVWILPYISMLGSAVLCYLLYIQEKNDLRQCLLCFGGQVLMMCAGLVLCAALRQGREAWYSCAAEGREPSGWQIFYWLRPGKSARAFSVRFLIAVRKIGWFSLLLFPGTALFGTEIFRVYRGYILNVADAILLCASALCIISGMVFSAILCEKYSLVFQLLSVYPQSKTLDLLKKSAELTEGKCMRIFVFRLSYLPWMLTCAAGIPMFYAVPYYYVGTACLRRTLLPNKTR